MRTFIHLGFNQDERGRIVFDGAFPLIGGGRAAFNIRFGQPGRAWGYVADHGIIYNPLLDQGYLSIGCAPTTKPVEPGADPRSGRWAGSDKTECGLHT